jgi:hypothetical protein
VPESWGGGLIGETNGHGYDIHEAQHSRDMQIAAATDAVISSLSRIHLWAIYRSCSIATVWRFPHSTFESTWLAARSELEVLLLRRNSATSVLF